MIPKHNQQVKCFLKNSLCIEGLVQSWDDEQVVLKTASGEKLLVICHPKEEILMFEVTIEKLEEPKYPPTIQMKPVRLEEQFEELKLEPPTDLRNKKLGELKILLNEEDRKALATRLQSHTIKGDVAPAQYGIPSFLKGK